MSTRFSKFSLDVLDRVSSVRRLKRGAPVLVVASRAVFESANGARVLVVVVAAWQGSTEMVSSIILQDSRGRKCGCSTKTV